MVQETDAAQKTNTDPVKRKRGWSHYWLYAVSGGVYVVDQLVKLWAEQTLGPANSGRSIEILGGFFRFIYIKNTGASFGFLKDAPWLFAGLAGLVSIGIIVWYQVQGTDFGWYKLGTGLILGGVVGNLSDRLFKEGAVTDMFNFPDISLFRIFNVADTAITFGVIIILLTTLLTAWQQSKSEKAPQGKGE